MVQYEEARCRTGGVCQHCRTQDVPVTLTAVWRQTFELCDDCRELPVRELENRLIPALGKLRRS